MDHVISKWRKWCSHYALFRVWRFSRTIFLELALLYTIGFSKPQRSERSQARDTRWNEYNSLFGNKLQLRRTEAKRPSNIGLLSKTGCRSKSKFPFRVVSASFLHNNRIVYHYTSCIRIEEYVCCLCILPHQFRHFIRI